MTNLVTGSHVTPRILCPELVGREAESAALDELLIEAAAGVTKTALIAGDAGVGKTALVRRFVDRARASGAQVLTGDCMQGEARRPFGPFIDLVRSAEKEISATAVENSIRRNAVELFRLLPEHGASEEGSRGVAGARARIHECFVAFLGDLARRRTLVVLLEDIHWSDESSLELFLLLARRLRSRAVLIVGTYRTDELDRLHPLRPVLAELVRARLANIVPVGPLTTEGSAAVIRGALRWEPPAEFRAAIHERCEGNPFFIEEVLQALAERGTLIHNESGWLLDEASAGRLAIPATIHDAVQDRVALLDTGARRTLEVAAVIGQRFEFALLAAVTGATEADITRALRAAVEAQLVVEVDGGHAYAFRHALTRETVLAELLERERRMLHLAIGEAIESAAAGLTERAEELAYHFDEAHDEVRALRYRDLAAREAARVAAYSRATHHLERALVLAPADSVALADLHLRLAEVAGHASDLPRERRAALAASELYTRLGDQLGLGTALLALSRNHFMTGDVAGSVALQAQAVGVLEPLGDSEALARAYAEIAWQANARPRNDDGERLAERAVEFARRAKAPGALAWALQALGLARIAAGRPDPLGPLRDGLRVALDNDIADTAQRGYLNLRAALWAVGAPNAEREAVLVECEAHARRFALRTPTFLQHVGWSSLGVGDWEKARAVAAELAGSGSAYVCMAELLVAFIELARRGPAHAMPAVDDAALRIMRSDHSLVTMAGQYVVLLYTLAGDPRKALRFADSAPTSVLGSNALMLCALLAAIAADDGAAVGRWIERPLAQVGWARSPIATAWQHVTSAERYLRDDKLDSAADALALGTRSLVDHENRFMETLVRLRRADVLLQRTGATDDGGAAAELADAVAFWHRVGATWYLGQLRAWAKDRGVPFPRPHAAHRAKRSANPTELTTREREVAMLVGQGLTNREIATKLVISERTAEGHIEQIRNKLGVRNRSLIAVWAAGDRG